MTIYRHALWAPSSVRPLGIVYGAPVALFREAFPGKVRELGVPLLVWETDSLRPAE